VIFLSLCITSKDIEDISTIGEKLLDLAGIVFRKHFYASYEEKEDLISIGVLKALTLISGGTFDNEKGKVINFLYTGMRNEMHNYIYHKNKKIKGMDVLGESVFDVYFEDDGFEIDFCFVAEVCSGFLIYGDLKFEVSEELKRRGFCVVGIQDDIISESSLVISEEFKKDLLDRLCGVVLWKSRECSL
jgi:hypothetical protein